MKIKLPKLGLKRIYSPGHRQLAGLILLAIVAAASAVGYLAWQNYHDKNQPKPTPSAKVPNDKKLDASQVISTSLSLAGAGVNKQNFDAANSEYLFAATAAYNEGDYQKSKNLLQECLNKVPDANISWDIYRSLAATGQQLKDKELEKTSLQKALAKATAPGSDVSRANISYMQNRLQELSK